MTDLPVTEAPQRPVPAYIGNRLRVLLALALLGGIASQQGLPGSIIAILPLALLALICWPLRWASRSPRFKLMMFMSLGATAAIALEPGPLNLTVGWVSLALLAFTGHHRNTPLLAESLLSVTRQALYSPAATLHAAAEIPDEFRSRKIGLSDWRKALLPVLAVLCFTLLFMVSNDAFSRIIRNSFSINLDPAWLRTLIAALIILQLLWAAQAMQPQGGPQLAKIDGQAPAWHEVLFSRGSVIVTLWALNAVFLMQNVLDAQFLWSGVLGTPGNGYSAYAQRGAATLIVTVLLAALLMIISLWPGSQASKSRIVQILVVAWILQNAFLLASCTARLSFYIDAYGMTLLRLASLIWMGLIACGLCLVALRILKKRGNLWLVNANVITCGLLLWVCSAVDFNAVVASYNADWRLQKVGYDSSYMIALGPSALPALQRARANGSLTKEQENWLVERPTKVLQDQLNAQQADWRSWTVRGAIIEWQTATASLPLAPESVNNLACPPGLTDPTSSSPSPSASATSSPGSACRAPSLPPGHE